VHRRALGVPGGLLPVGVQHADAGAGLRGADGAEQGAVVELDRDAVVRRVGRDDLGGRQRVGGLQQGRGLEDRGVSGAIGEEDGLVAVFDDVAGGRGVEDQIGEPGFGGPGAAGAVGPGAGVEHLEPVGGGDQDVSAVPGGVQPVEAGQRDVGLEVEGLPVEHVEAAVVGEGHPGLRGRARIGGRAGARAGARAARRGIRAGAGRQEQGGGGDDGREGRAAVL